MMDRLIGDAGWERLVNLMLRIADGQEIPVRDASGAEVLGEPGTVSLARVPNLAMQGAAAKWLLERRWGKAKQTVEVEQHEESETIDLGRLSDAEMVELHRLVTAALPPGGEEP